jgi:RHS repeat-associated protein
MIKDHLGNVRMLLTEEQKVDKYPVASLETSKLSTEQAYYNINTNQIATGSSVIGLPTYTNDNGIGNNPPDPAFETSNSQKLYFLNSNNAKTGLGITLKVMAGDKIDIFGKSYYFQNNTGGSTANSAVGLLEILNGFLGTPAGAVASGAHEAVTATQLNSLSGTTSGINSLLSNQTTDNNQYTEKPKAYINYILFDEQFKSVGSGFSAVGENSELKDHHQDLQDIEVPKNGYVYIYCSNESPVDVYFDNLQVVHTQGRITEETHYYPFGFVMSGISSKDAGGIQNKFLYSSKELHSKEFSDGSGLEAYDYGARMYDQQLGRFWQVDPLADSMRRMSPYTFAYNNPIRFIDPDGMAPEDVVLDIQRTKNKDGTYSYSAKATINLTIVDPKGKMTSSAQQQAKDIAKNFGGMVYAKVGKEENVAINVSVELNLSVVSNAKDAKSTDYIIQAVQDIPGNPIGLGAIDGDVGAVESNLGSQMGKVVMHELGHIMGLQHSEGTLMNPNSDNNPSYQDTKIGHAAKRQLWGFIGNYQTNGTYRTLSTPKDSRQELKEFVQNNGITQ